MQPSMPHIRRWSVQHSQCSAAAWHVRIGEQQADSSGLLLRPDVSCTCIAGDRHDAVYVSTSEADVKFCPGSRTHFEVITREVSEGEHPNNSLSMPQQRMVALQHKREYPAWGNMAAQARVPCLVRSSDFTTC